MGLLKILKRVRINSYKVNFIHFMLLSGIKESHRQNGAIEIIDKDSDK